MCLFLVSMLLPVSYIATTSSIHSHLGGYEASDNGSESGNLVATVQHPTVATGYLPTTLMTVRLTVRFGVWTSWTNRRWLQNCCKRMYL